jgi:hypothetical protein
VRGTRGVVRHAVFLFMFGVYLLLVELTFSVRIEVDSCGPESGLAIREDQEEVAPLLIWCKLKDEPGEKTVILFNDEELDTTVDFDNHVVTAPVPVHLRKLPGHHTLMLRDVQSGVNTSRIPFRLLKPFLRILNFGPTTLALSDRVAGAQDHQTAVWFSYEGTVTPATRVFLSDKELQTAVDEKEEIISAIIPDELLQVGSLELKLIDKDTNMFSNSVVLQVNN